MKDVDKLLAAQADVRRAMDNIIKIRRKDAMLLNVLSQLRRMEDVLWQYSHDEGARNDRTRP